MMIFKAYDIRGVVPDELDPEIAYRIGRAAAQFLGAERVAVGRDARRSSPERIGGRLRG
jgi:phosphomannomutase